MRKKHKVSNQTTVEGVTLTEVAQVWGKSRDTVRAQMVAVNPIGKRGKENIYSLPAVRAVMEKVQPRTEKGSEKEKLERRKLDLQCTLLKIEIDVREGRLLPLDEVRRCFSIHTSAVRNQLLRQASELAPLLSGLSVEKIEKKINESGEEVMAILRKTEFDESPVGGGAKEVS
jgi:hypothetical protein